MRINFGALKHRKWSPDVFLMVACFYIYSGQPVQSNGYSKWGWRNRSGPSTSHESPGTSWSWPDSPNNSQSQKGSHGRHVQASHRNRERGVATRVDRWPMPQFAKTDQFSESSQSPAAETSTVRSRGPWVRTADRAYSRWLPAQRSEG